MKIPVIIPIVLFLSVFSGIVTADKYSGGTGEPNTPYLISTAEDLNDIGNHPEDFNRCFLMTADINLADYTGTQFNLIGEWIDWGDPNNKPFRGVFDGNGFSISKFTYQITGSDHDVIGLFRYIDDPNAEIKDLILFDPNVNSPFGNHVGSLVGRVINAKITGCGVEGGSVSGSNRTGGLVGNNYGTISNCFSTSLVSGYYYTGGLVGWNDDYLGSGLISNCYMGGIACGDTLTGGLVGINEGAISNCYATGEVLGNGYVWFSPISHISIKSQPESVNVLSFCICTVVLPSPPALVDWSLVSISQKENKTLPIWLHPISPPVSVAPSTFPLE